MKIFISWSGNSHGVAKAIRDVLPRLFDDAAPFISSEDMRAGSVWVRELEHQLSDADFGLVCLSKENSRSRWLHYEAGALSRRVGSKRRVLPVLLIDFDEETDAAGPLTGFQLTMATRDGFFKVVCAMNDLRSGKPVQEEILAERVDTFWPRIQEAVDEVRRADAPPTSRRDSAQLLGEVLRIVRGLGSQESADLDQSALTEGISNQILKKLSAADDGSGTSWTIFDHAVRNLAERLRATYNPDFLVGVYPEGGFIGYLLWLDSNRAWPLLLAPDADKPPLPEEIAAIGARVADICRGKTAPRGLIVDAAMKSGRTMRSTRELVLRACGERGIEPQLETLCLSVRDGYGLSHADRPTFFSLGGDYDLPFGS